MVAKWLIKHGYQIRPLLGFHGLLETINFNNRIVRNKTGFCGMKWTIDESCTTVQQTL